MVMMLSGLATPVEMKLKLIPSLRHMHHDTETASKVWFLFLSFIPIKLNNCSLTKSHNLARVIVFHFLSLAFIQWQKRYFCVKYFLFCFYFKAFAVCESLLAGYPARKFVVLTLNTMTQLAVSSLVSAAPHVSRLLRILASDPRHAVHLTCLHNLLLLAKHGPHLWQADKVEVMVIKSFG